jgi:hypothetical protein
MIANPICTLFLRFIQIPGDANSKALVENLFVHETVNSSSTSTFNSVIRLSCTSLVRKASQPAVMALAICGESGRRKYYSRRV